MHVTLEGLIQMKAILSRGLMGVNPFTGERNKPAKELPASMFRHLRRLLKAVDDELAIAEPERKAFAEKWAVDGKWPTPDSENYAEFAPLYNEMFNTPDFVLPFSPFKLELLDRLDEAIPTDLMGLMESANDIYEAEQKQNAPATGDSDNGPESPEPNA